MFNIFKISEGTVDDYEAFLEKYSSVLHKNHYHMVTAKHSLMQMLGRTEGHLIQNMDAEGVRTGIFHSMYFFLFFDHSVCSFSFLLFVAAFVAFYIMLHLLQLPLLLTMMLLFADTYLHLMLLLWLLLLLLAAVDDSAAKNIAAVCGLLVLIANEICVFQLHRKESLCRELITLCRQLDPCSVRLQIYLGVALYELHLPLLQHGKRAWEAGTMATEEFRFEYYYFLYLLENVVLNTLKYSREVYGVAIL